MLVNTYTPGDQRSPAVTLDDAGRAVVTWYGPASSSMCTTQSTVATRVFGQQLRLVSGGLASVGLEFNVDNAYPNAAVNVNPGDFSPPLPNPTVTWAATAGQPDRYFIAWNTLTLVGSIVNEVHGQYVTFTDSGPRLIYKEFRVPREQGWTGLPGRETRMLATSGQHTVASANGAIIASWFRRDVSKAPPQDALGVYATILPPTFDAALCCAESCCRGDANGDGLVNGADIQDFIEFLYIHGYGTLLPCMLVSYICAVDVNGDCQINDADRLAFICLLLALPNCTACTNSCSFLGAPQPGFASGGAATEPPGACAPGDSAAQASAPGSRDCNGNGIPDDVEIADGSAADCNRNGIPDECDLGFDPGVTDSNHNMIPDECEPQLAAAAQPVLYHVGSGVPCPNGEAVMKAITAWSAGVNWNSMSAWHQGYEIKQKLAEFGIAMQ